MIKTNATGMDLRRGLVGDGIIRPPTSQHSSTVKIIVDNSLPDQVWVMNAHTLKGVEFMVKGLTAPQ